MNDRDFGKPQIARVRGGVLDAAVDAPVHVCSADLVRRGPSAVPRVGRYGRRRAGGASHAPAAAGAQHQLVQMAVLGKGERGHRVVDGLVSGGPAPAVYWNGHSTTYR